MSHKSFSFNADLDHDLDLRIFKWNFYHYGASAGSGVERIDLLDLLAGCCVKGN